MWQLVANKSSWRNCLKFGFTLWVGLQIIFRVHVFPFSLCGSESLWSRTVETTFQKFGPECDIKLIQSGGWRSYHWSDNRKNILFGYLVQQQRSKFSHVFIILTRGIYFTRAPMPGQWFTRKLAYPQKRTTQNLATDTCRNQETESPAATFLSTSSGSPGNLESLSQQFRFRIATFTLCYLTT